MLLVVGLLLVFQVKGIMPWPLKPSTSSIVGWIFVGDSLYFFHGLRTRRWHDACAQLWSFLAYDLVLLQPLIAHFARVPDELRLNLIIYVAVLISSALLAIWFLFVDRRTRGF